MSETIQIQDYLPVLALCGYSGSGKTTLILQLIDHFRAHGKRVGVVKHDVHGLSIDREGKDSDRFFKAGADVIMRGPEQTFLRSHRAGDLELMSVIRRIAPHYDIILLEGHKSTPHFDKIWVYDEMERPIPPEADCVKLRLSRQTDRFAAVVQFIVPWLEKRKRLTPVNLGILTSGVDPGVEVPGPFAGGCIFGPAGTFSLDWPVIPTCLAPDLQSKVATAFRLSPLTPWLFAADETLSLAPDLLKTARKEQRTAMVGNGALAYIDFRVFPFGEMTQTFDSFDDLNPKSE